MIVEGRCFISGERRKAVLVSFGCLNGFFRLAKNTPKYLFQKDPERERMNKPFLLTCVIWTLGVTNAFCSNSDAGMGNKGSIPYSMADNVLPLEAPKFKHNIYSSSGYRKIDLRRSKATTQPVVGNPVAQELKKQVVREPAGIPSLNRIRPASPAHN